MSISATVARACAGWVAVVALAATATAQNTHIVRVGPGGLDTFEPKDLIVCEGDTVIWDWETGVHNVRDNNLAFNSGSPVLPPNTFTVTFDAAFVAANPAINGVYDYVCDLHIAVGMVGSIQVVAPRLLAATATAGAGGQISVSGGIPGNTLLLGYSLAGNGPQATAFGTLALSPPFTQLAPQTFDAAGDVNLSVNVPAGAAGATVHLHGLERLGGGTGVFIRPLTIVVQ